MGDDMHVKPGFHLSGTPGCPAARHLNGVEIGIRNGAGARCRRLSPCSQNHLSFPGARYNKAHGTEITTGPTRMRVMLLR
jgi:hypothetical protein